MSSHAVFNALTYVQHQIVSSEGRAALKALSAFAEFIRKSSDDVDQSSRGLYKEYGMLQSYCTLEEWRFSERLKINLELKAVEDQEVPSFLFAPFVEQLLLSLLTSNQEETQMDIRVDSKGIKVQTSAEVKIMDDKELNEEQKRRKALFMERLDWMKEHWDIKIKSSSNNWSLLIMKK